jgi:hypothetical protein
LFGFALWIVVQDGFFISLFVFDDMVCSNDDFVPYGNYRFFLTTPGYKALVLPFQVTILFAGCAPGAFG